MTEGARYLKIVEWSEEDQCFIGSCPEMFCGGCHGDDERQVLDDLCSLVEEMIALYEAEGRSLPTPLAGKDLVNRLQTIAAA